MLNKILNDLLNNCELTSCMNTYWINKWRNNTYQITEDISLLLITHNIIEETSGNQRNKLNTIKYLIENINNCDILRELKILKNIEERKIKLKKLDNY